MCRLCRAARGYQELLVSCLQVLAASVYSTLSSGHLTGMNRLCFVAQAGAAPMFRELEELVPVVLMQ